MVAYVGNKFRGNIRQCRVAWRYILLNTGEQFTNYPSQDVKLFNDIINNKLIGNRGLLDKLMTHCHFMIMPKSDLSWINNDRVIFTIYKKMEHMKREMNGNLCNFDTNTGKYFWGRDLLHFAFNINFNKTSAKGKYDTIIEMLDVININFETKINLLEQFKSLCHHNSKLCNFSWFNRTPDNEQWLLDYMSNLISTNKVEYNRDNGPIEDFFHSAIEIFDMWCAHDDTKKLFIVKLKKSYQQKVYRDNKSDKEKNYSYSMRHDISDLMNDLSIKLGMPKNKILERLIREEHKEVFGDN